MLVVYEWLVNPEGYAAEQPRDVETFQSVYARIITGLDLHVVGESVWHHLPTTEGDSRHFPSHGIASHLSYAS
jgi:hypothetical protein